MKEHFIRLFEYDRFANQIILDTMAKAGNPEKPVKLMAHTLAAQETWLNRCKGLPAIAGALWPDWAAESLQGIMTENSVKWLDFLSGLSDEDFERQIDYKDTKGNSWQNKLVDVLTQLTNHGTHHRAQAGQHLIAAGIQPLPLTDYIFYIRMINAR